MQHFRRHNKQRTGSAVTAAMGSLAVLGLLILLLLWQGGYLSSDVSTSEELVIYCAGGVRPAVQPVAERYEQEFGVRVRLQPGSSGVLEQQLQQRGQGDLYIPAGIEPFLTRGRDRGYIEEIIPLADFRLVMVVRPGNPKQIATLDDLLRGDVDIVIADEHAAVGKATRNVLSEWNGFADLEEKATNKPTVTEVANDLQIGVRADVGFVWDATARQMGLEIVELDEVLAHAASRSTIGAGVLSYTTQPANALRFARYLAAPDKGQASFATLHYTPVEGDAWAVIPRLTLFSGGVNRTAIEQTIAEFQEREGCEVTTTYQGCGSLVSMMTAGQLPDAYFACDVSFVDQVAEQFSQPVTISATDMVLLVKPGNPKGIHSLTDLGRKGIRIGLADEQLSALGRLSVELLKGAGVYESVIRNRRATTPTADMLVIQMMTVDKLDAAIVYRANCNKVGDAAEVVDIDHPAAKARQPLAIQLDTKFPQLSARLMQSIVSSRSRARFEKSGFNWQYKVEPPQPENANTTTNDLSSPTSR